MKASQKNFNSQVVEHQNVKKNSVFSSHMSWWQERPMRIIEIVNAFDISAFTLEQEADMVVKFGGNTQHFHCWQSYNGMDDQGMFFKSKVNKKNDNEDRLGAYLPIAHKKGIRVVVYFNVHWYNKEFGGQNPEWRQLTENRRPIDNVYSTGTSFCINSAYREWVFQVLADLCMYEIDGIFYDGPIFFSNTCYCKTCRRLFKDKYGAELPPKSDQQNGLREKLFEFQANSIKSFLADSEQVIKGINREILFYMNGNGGSPYWPTGRDNHKIIMNTDILAAEGGFLHGDLNKLPIYKPGITAKLLESQAKNKPTVIFDCVGQKPWSWYPLPAAEVKILLSETVTNAANYWLALFPDDVRNMRLVNEVSNFSNFVKHNPEPFFKTESLAKTALLWPYSSLEFYSGSSVPLSDFTRQMESRGIGDISKEFFGFYQGLHQQQIVFDVLDESRLENLPRYTQVILPNIACLPEKAVENISQYVRNGGNIIATFETSLYNATGVKLADFQLAELFGIRFKGKIFGPMKWDYISLNAKKAPFLSEAANNKFLPAPEYSTSVGLTTGRPLGYFYQRLQGRYDNVPAISREAFLVENEFGNGKAYYFPGIVGTVILEYNFPEYNMILKHLIFELSSPAAVLENAPNVEFNHRKANDKMYFYLLNLNGGPKRPFTKIMELSDIKIACQNLKIRSVRALRLGKKLKIESKGTQTVISLPHLSDFEVIVAE